MTTKRLIADSCSLILLNKAGLFSTLTKAFQVYVPPKVFKEITSVKHQDGQIFKDYLQKGRYYLKLLPHQWETKDIPLNGGEREVLILFETSPWNACILTDDKKLAQLCRQKGYPYLNALTAAIQLWKNGYIDLQTLHQKLLQLIQLGRYSQWVVEYAFQKCGLKSD